MCQSHITCGVADAVSTPNLVHVDVFRKACIDQFCANDNVVSLGYLTVRQREWSIAEKNG